jgi:hypothetical protein
MKVSELIKMLESVNGDSEVEIQNMVYDGKTYLPHFGTKPNMVITNENGKVYITHYVEHRVETDNGDLPNNWIKIDYEMGMNNLLTKKLSSRRDDDGAEDWAKYLKSIRS